MIESDNTWQHLQIVREKAPLVHNITNYVVMNSTANALLAVGASPVMAHAREEVKEMACIAGALVINIGTLSPHWVEAMEIAMETASERNIPIIVDPVGAGATLYRTDTVNRLINRYSPDVIRGNASEISALYSADFKTKGVDSTEKSDSALEAARFLANEYNCVVVVSGEVDYIISEKVTKNVQNGNPLMTKVTGMGCTATALVGAFAAVIEDLAAASVSAMQVMGIAGEMAGDISEGPGSLQMNFLDAIYQMNKSDIKKRLKPEAAHA
jgi:hydroxyethylthiazole kinase